MTKKPIKLKVIKDTAISHFGVSFERPGRIEITLTDKGRLVAYIYDGAKVNVFQDPIGLYDSNINNKDWVDK